MTITKRYAMFRNSGAGRCESAFLAAFPPVPFAIIVTAVFVMFFAFLLWTTFIK